MKQAASRPRPPLPSAASGSSSRSRSRSTPSSASAARIGSGDLQVVQRVVQQPADQEFQRQVVDALAPVAVGRRASRPSSGRRCGRARPARWRRTSRARWRPRGRCRPRRSAWRRWRGAAPPRPRPAPAGRCGWPPGCGRTAGPRGRRSCGLVSSIGRGHRRTDRLPRALFCCTGRSVRVKATCLMDAECGARRVNPALITPCAAARETGSEPGQSGGSHGPGSAAGYARIEAAARGRGKGLRFCRVSRMNEVARSETPHVPSPA